MVRKLSEHLESSTGLMSVQEAAEYLRIPAPSVYHLINTGKLTARKINNWWRIEKKVLDEILYGNDPRIFIQVENSAHRRLISLALEQIGPNVQRLVAENIIITDQSLSKLPKEIQGFTGRVILLVSKHIPRALGDSIDESSQVTFLDAGDIADKKKGLRKALGL